MPTSAEISRAVTSAACDCLDECVTKIRHCVDQLSDQQIWWRPADELNSIGNLMLHLSGNLRQWIVAGLTGAADTRTRPAEFSERGPIPKAQLLEQLQSTVDDAKRVLSGMPGTEILQPREIQGFHVTGVGAIFDSIPHFKGHTQETICLTRMQLGSAYQFHWQPTTPEQGA